MGYRTWCFGPKYWMGYVTTLCGVYRGGIVALKSFNIRNMVLYVRDSDDFLFVTKYVWVRSGLHRICSTFVQLILKVRFRYVQRGR